MSEEHTCRTCQHLLQNNICGSDEHKTMQLDDVCGAWEESILAKLITEHPKRIPLEFQNAELLQKVQQLEYENKLTWQEVREIQSAYEKECQHSQELSKENAELKAIIKEMMSAIDDNSNLCTVCKKEYGESVCSSECPWAQTRDRGKEWTEEIAGEDD